MENHSTIDLTKYTSRDWYRGIEGLKKSGVKTEMTPEIISELKKCYHDIEHFTSNYVYIVSVDDGKIKFVPRDYQKKFWKIIEKDRFVISKQGRQLGKSTAIVGYLLHYAVFNRDKNIGIAAQNIAQAREIMSRFKMAYESLPTWMQSGVVTWNKGSIELGNGTKIFASSSNGDALRGQSLSMLILDEFAHLRNDRDFMDSTFPVVSSGKKTKIIIISTPNGVGNAFHDIWKSCDEDNPDAFTSYSVPWNAIPMRDKKWKETKIKEVGQRKFNQEYAAEFVGSSNTLVEGEKLEEIEKTCYEPIRNFEGDNGKIFKEPVEGARYAMTVDVSRGYGGDFSTFSIFRVDQKPYEMVATFKDNMTSTKIFPYIVYQYATKYNEAFVAVERNESGGDVANTLYYDIEYEEMYVDKDKGNVKPGMWTSKSSKRSACAALRDLMESDNIFISDIETVKEMKTFEGNKSGIYNAKKGSFDDLVQNCWMFSYLLDTKYFSYFNEEIDGVTKTVHEQRIQEIMNDLPAAGSLLNGMTEEELERKLSGNDGVIREFIL